MSEEILNSLSARLDRLEAVTSYSLSPRDRGDEIDALKGELKALRADLANRDIEIRDLRSIVAGKVTKADVTSTLNAHIPKHIEVIGDFMADTINDTTKTLRNDIDDATRSISREVERAEAAASSNIKSAAAIIAAWSAELGA